MDEKKCAIYIESNNKRVRIHWYPALLLSILALFFILWAEDNEDEDEEEDGGLRDGMRADDGDVVCSSCE